MSDLMDLYQELILDHNKKPRNFGALESASHHADGDNPLCGDEIHLELSLKDDRVEDVAFQGAGCAISTASASLMTDAIRGKTLQEIHALSAAVRKMLKGEEPENAANLPDLGKLEALSGIRAYPMRVKCATLAWHTLEAALEHPGNVVSTEA